MLNFASSFWSGCYRFNSRDIYFRVDEYKYSTQLPLWSRSHRVALVQARSLSEPAFCQRGQPSLAAFSRGTSRTALSAKANVSSMQFFFFRSSKKWPTEKPSKSYDACIVNYKFCRFSAGTCASYRVLLKRRTPSTGIYRTLEGLLLWHN